ncbi:MAG: polysaccharide deacetylase family protein, partial [Betaproteobacteria bacterium]|nr:polysaccharide deacetylase family protein [Betaproteobacteria bacterium]
TFLFSLGPDNTGRAVRRAFRRGFMGKVKRTSVVEHYGIKTLLYGTLLPGPDIGRRCAAQLRAVREAGFEVGIHCWDHVRWQDYVAARDAAWTERELRRACDRFEEVFGTPAQVHGAAGWQTNVHAARYLGQHGFAYTSDTRGTQPYLPVWEGGFTARPELPTTLPTLDELIGLDGITAQNVAERLLEISQLPPQRDHVYTLHAELEGGRLAPVFDTLLEGWREQGYALVSLADYANGLDTASLPRHQIELGSVPGRSGTLAVQGREIRA